MALDEIQNQNNVLFCKSAGNCLNFATGQPLGRIFEGADSVRALTVGSIADRKSGFDISEPDNLSPFSRKGPGPAFIIKPDVVHYGGNAGIDFHGRKITSGVKSFSFDGRIMEMAGTSFSTPRVSALAAGLFNRMDGEFDPLILKGLIIHSAKYPERVELPETRRAEFLGFGLPDTVDNILFNSPNQATLVLRSSLPKGQTIDIKDFPMPDSLIKDGFFTGQVIVTLVYNPILDPTQGFEYCQSNMDVKFGSYDEKSSRDTSKKGILNPVGREGAQNVLLNSIYSKKLMKNGAEESALKERMQIEHGDKYYPVKKYAIDLSELSENKRMKFASPGKKWYLTLQGSFRSHVEDMANSQNLGLNQEFCLIITVRDPGKNINVNDGITQKLEEHSFWHTKINLSESIRIDL